MRKLIFLLLLVETASNSPTASAASGGTVAVWGLNGNGQANVPIGLSGVIAIAAGNAHTVALKTNGTVVAWGNNPFGETNVPVGLSGVKAIAAGNAHTVALKTDGTVIAWGSNGSGQTTCPAGLSGVTAIAAGGSHTVALKSNGTVEVWGAGTVSAPNGGVSGLEYGQALVPAGLSGVSAIAAAGNHTVALKSDGTVVAWGLNASGQTNVPGGLSGVTAIAAGRGGHTVALKSDGTVVAWGAGTMFTGAFPEFGQSLVPAGLNGVAAITAGGFHTIALKTDGTAVAWGAGTTSLPSGGISGAEFGQSIVPNGLNGVVAIAAGGFHSAALIVSQSPSITAQPASLMLSLSSAATFSVTATGTAPLSYQWRKDGAVLAGATISSLTITNVQLGDAGSYSVVITNIAGSVTSQAATLSVTNAPIGATNFATVSGHGQSIVFLRVTNFTSGGFPADVNLTTFDGSTAAAPLRQPSASAPGGFLYSGEIRPRAAGVYEADYATTKDADGSYLSFGSLMLNLPTTDVDTNGLPDFAQRDKPGAAATGSYIQDWPSSLTVPISGNLTRSAGAVAGTYRLVDTSTGGNLLDISGPWELAYFAGSFAYTRQTQNSATFTLIRTNAGIVCNLTATTTFSVASNDTITFPQFTATNAADGSILTALASTFHRAGNKYVGALQFQDGDARTTWADFTSWVFEITDLNDTNANGIPDLSDALPSSPTITVSPAGTNLTLLWPATAGRYRLESAGTIAVPVSWSNVTGGFQTNGGVISVVQPMSGARKFYRLAEP